MIISGPHPPAVRLQHARPAGQPRLVTSASSFGRLSPRRPDLRPPHPATSCGRRSSGTQHASSPATCAKDPAQTALIDRLQDARRADREQGPRPDHRPTSRRTANAGGRVARSATSSPTPSSPTRRSSTGGQTPVDRVHEPRRHPRRPHTPTRRTARRPVTSPTRRRSRSSRSTTTSSRWTSPGAQIKELLRAAVDAARNVADTARKILQVSRGLHLHLHDGTGGRGRRTGHAQRHADRRHATTYRIVTNNFLSDGGDGFPAFTSGTDKYFGGLDIDAFATYLHGALALHARCRSTASPSSRPAHDATARQPAPARSGPAPFAGDGAAAWARGGRGVRRVRRRPVLGGGDVLGRDEAVADVAHRADEHLVLGAELGPQPADVDVDGARAAVVVVAPDLLEQLGAGEDPARVLGEVLEELELLVGQVEQPPADPRGVGRLVDVELARGDLQRLGLVVGVLAARSSPAAAAPRPRPGRRSRAGRRRRPTRR